MIKSDHGAKRAPGEAIAMLAVLVLQVATGAIATAVGYLPAMDVGPCNPVVACNVSLYTSIYLPIAVSSGAVIATVVLTIRAFATSQRIPWRFGLHTLWVIALAVLLDYVIYSIVHS